MLKNQEIAHLLELTGVWPRVQGSFVVKEWFSGGQADIAIIELPSGQKIVVKKYRSNCDETFHNEVVSLNKLGALTPYHVNARWRILSPCILATLESQQVIVMQYFSGTQLWAALRDWQGNMSDVAGAVYKALREYWDKTNTAYGDINLKNILVGEDPNDLFFLDPGYPDNRYVCSGIPRDFYPMSRDIAYFLYGITIANTKLQLRDRELSNRQMMFARHFVEHIKLDPAYNAAFKEEIWACIKDHYGRDIPLIHPKGIYRRLLRLVGQKNAASLLDISG